MSTRSVRIYSGPPDNVDYIILPEERIEEALRMQQDSMGRENVALGFGLSENPSSGEKMKIIFREMVKDRCSLVAVNTETDEIVGVCFNKLHVPKGDGDRNELEVFVANNIRDERCRGLIDFLSHVESKVDLFQYYGASCVLELFYVGTDSRFVGHGIGLNLLKASIELGRSLRKSKKMAHHTFQIAPEVAFGIFTSNSSQRIASRLGFQWLATVPYDEYYWRGKKLFGGFGDVHETAQLGAVRINMY